LRIYRGTNERIRRIGAIPERLKSAAAYFHLAFGMQQPAPPFHLAFAASDPRRSFTWRLAASGQRHSFTWHLAESRPRPESGSVSAERIGAAPSLRPLLAESKKCVVFCSLHPRSPHLSEQLVNFLTRSLAVR
jgi:hypothetical protein